MAAELITRFKDVTPEGGLIELVIWRLPEPLPSCGIGTSTAWCPSSMRSGSSASTTNAAKGITGTSQALNGPIGSLMSTD